MHAWEPILALAEVVLDLAVDFFLVFEFYLLGLLFDRVGLLFEIVGQLKASK